MLIYLIFAPIEASSHQGNQLRVPVFMDMSARSYNVLFGQSVVLIGQKVRWSLFGIHVSAIAGLFGDATLTTRILYVQFIPAAIGIAVLLLEARKYRSSSE